VRRRLWFVLGAIILLSLVISGAVLALTRYGTHTFSGQVFDPVHDAGDFQLTDEAGKPFALSDLRGEWILLTYGYTTCPDVCPLTLGNLKQVKAQLGSQAEHVRIVFVSVDPERDTPDVMQRYVRHFGDDLKGLTGSLASVALAARIFGVRYEKRASDSAVGYLVSHSAYVYLIDPRFRWRVTFPFGVRPDEIAGDLRYLMSQKTEAQ
jgi:protein SCO1/2